MRQLVGHRPLAPAKVIRRNTDGNGAGILEVRVFKRGQFNDTKYVALHETGYDSSIGGTAAKLSSYDGWGDLSDAGRNDSGKEMLRNDLYVEKNAYGAPVIKSRSGSEGPDYRLSANEMTQAYEDFNLEKHESELRENQAKGRDARSNYAQKQREYQAERNKQNRSYIERFIKN